MMSTSQRWTRVVGGFRADQSQTANHLSIVEGKQIESSIGMNDGRVQFPSESRDLRRSRVCTIADEEHDRPGAVDEVCRPVEICVGRRLFGSPTQRGDTHHAFGGLRPKYILRNIQQRHAA